MPQSVAAVPPIDELRETVIQRARARLMEIQGNKARYDADFATFAGDCLTIRPKEGGDRLFRLNEVQRGFDARLDNQLATRGRVRALALKGRQFGISTYTEGRYYWKATRIRGLKAFIMTHHDDATANIFQMVKRFHENDPHAPVGDAKLYFKDLDSGFQVATAGSKGAGRSFTFQLFHGSEVAFWPNAADHAAGALEAVPDKDGTEVILESTANGIGGFFYNKCMAAMRGEDEFELIFMPWFDHSEYSTPAPADWRPPDAFMEMAETHRLDRDRVYWAYRTNARLAAAEGDPVDEICWKFKQEYPGDPMEAFRASREGSFISAQDTARARKKDVGDQSHAPLVFGCDFATGGDGEGGDANYFIDRQGRAAGKRLNERFTDKNTVSVANKLQSRIDQYKPDMVFMDPGGGGSQVRDILADRGYGHVLTLVNFGSGALDNKKYANKRAEIWSFLREWMRDEGGASIPDDDGLDGDITAPEGNEDLNHRTQIEKKDRIRKRLGFSPDGGDALALTFSFPVQKGREFTTVGTAVGDPTVGY